jgi:hypothetical protein
MLNMRLYGQRLILGSLIVLWAGVLPWLCWGAWGSPNHPHPSPHFVFAAPPLYSGELHVHPHLPSEQQGHNHASPVGATYPDTLLITLLVMIIPVTRIAISTGTQRFVQKVALSLVCSCWLAVPTPPPRSLPSR